MMVVGVGWGWRVGGLEGYSEGRSEGRGEGRVLGWSGGGRITLLQFSLHFLPSPNRFATPIAFPPFRFPPLPSFPSSPSPSSPSRFPDLFSPTLTLPLHPLPNKLPDFRVLAGVS